MRILIADDDPGIRLSLEERLTSWGYQVVACADGEEALRVLLGSSPPPIAILDWTMPGLEGPEVCRGIRERSRWCTPYLILLTARTSKDDVVAGFLAGADDYIAKPFDARELWARLQVAQRFVNLQDRLIGLAGGERESDIYQLTSGRLWTCAHCRRIRDNWNHWQDFESHPGSHAGLQFTHSICPDCMAVSYVPKHSTAHARG